MKNGFSLDANHERLLRSLISDRSRQGLTAVLMLGVVYILAKTSWTLLPLDVPLPSAIPTGMHNAENMPRSPSIDLKAITSATWFGTSVSTSSPSVDSSIQPSLSLAEAEAVASSLRVNLLGVILADDEKLSRVIVDQQGKHQQFSVGETLPVGRNVKVVKVLSDRIIVDNAGRYEYIALYESDQKALGQVAAAPRVVAVDPVEEPQDIFVDHSNDQEITTMLSEVKQKVLSDPASMTQLVTIGAHYQDGDLVGYTLAPGSMRKEFSQLGLQTGDILVSVNGMPLNTPEALPQVMAAMQSGMVDLELLRNGGSVNISVSMDTP
ncbi:MAG TPA: type II secretion system protein GspC [Pseudomonadales bacterium]|nr:type II secretion system protein GspC [Pseudomonadales bacterium]